VGLNLEKKFESDDLVRSGHIINGVIDIWQRCGIGGRFDTGCNWYCRGGKTSMRHIPRSEWWAYIKWRIRKMFARQRYEV
jgi:hypothetical protein